VNNTGGIPVQLQGGVGMGKPIHRLLYI